MKNKVKATGTVEFQRAITYLEELLEKLKAGDLVLSHGENSVVFHPKEAVELEIEAKEKDGKQKFSFEMSWKEGLRADEMPDFSISSAEHFAGAHSMAAESEHRKFRASGESAKTAGKSERFARESTARAECMGFSGSLEAPATCSEL